jgi:CRP/FNR family cyclic AMP-dependent transcriptional regulator
VRADGPGRRCRSALGGGDELRCTESMPTTSPLATALSEHPFLSSIPLASLRRLATHVRSRTYGAGQEIFREGDPADRFFLIRHGLVLLEVDVPGADGPKRIEIETLGADAALGWSWLFSPYGWQLSATAVKRTATLVFDADMVRSVMAADPVLGYELMRRFAAVMFDRLQATRARLIGNGSDVPSAGAGGPWAGKRTTAQLWS